MTGSAVPQRDGGKRDEIARILAEARTVAVVGLSPREQRDSHRVALYLQQHGYRIVPVNPNVSEVLGEKSYPTLGSIPPDIRIDVVDVFRRPFAVRETVEQAIARGVPVVWLQLGVIDEEAAERARRAGLTVVSDRCMKVEHARRG
jgi:predicted CoA-binding protein